MEPAAVLKGDRFVIRDANDTLGGGIIVDTQARRHPRRRPGVLAALERQQTGSPADVLYAAIAAGDFAEALAASKRTDLSQDAAAAALRELVDDGRVVIFGEGAGALALTREAYERYVGRAEEAIAAHVKAHPLRPGLGREELRSRLGLAQRPFGLLIDAIVREGMLADAGASIAPPGWAPQLNAAQTAAAQQLVTMLRATPFTPPTDKAPDEDLVAFLVHRGDIVDVGDGLLFDAEAFERMVSMVVARLRESKTISLGEVRDLLGSSRRYVQPLLEYLDRERITLRRGDERVLGPRAASLP
jgi:selenocysteine-specific elongation factor